MKFLFLCSFFGFFLPHHAEAVPHRWTPTYGSPFGINVHNLGWDSDPKAVSAIKDLGVGWIRVDFDWISMEPSKGQYNWTVADGLIAMAEANQLNVFATLAYAPDWAVATPAPDKRPPPRSSADWQAFIQAVVGRYKGRISHWGVWNEPNLDHFLSFPAGVTRSQRMQTYIQTILLPGIQAVKQADPDALAVGSDLAHLGGSSFENKDHAWQPWLDEILKQAGASLDILSHHTYQSDYTRTLDGTVYPWEYPSVLDTIRNRGFGQKPIWITEIGWQSNKISEADHAANYKTLVDSMLARPWWKKLFPYELKDDPNIPEKWGVVRADWSRKPSWTAYRDAILAKQPVPKAGGDRTVQVGASVLFDASASTDPDGQIVEYSWDFDHTDGVTSDAKGAQVSHRFAKAGVYLVTLTVKDNHGIAIGTRVKITAQDSGQPTEIPVPHAASPPQIDGDLKDWPATPLLKLGSREYVAVSEPLSGPSDLAAEVWWSWSPQGLFFAARITDDTHANLSPVGQLWMGDSIQIAFDADGDRSGPGYDTDGDFEYGLARSRDQSAFERTTAPAGSPASTLQVAVRRQGSLTTYEAFFPAAELRPLRFQAKQKIFASFLVNDDDGKGRKGWLEWSPGIGKAKDPRLFPALVLMAPSGSPEPTPEPPPSERKPEPSPELKPEPLSEPPRPDGSTPPDSLPDTASDGLPSDASETPLPPDEPRGFDRPPPPPDQPASPDPKDPEGPASQGCTCQEASFPETSLLGFLLLFLALALSRRR